MKETNKLHYCRHCDTKMVNGEYLIGVPYHNSDNMVLDGNGKIIGAIIYCPNCGEMRIALN